MAAHTLVHDIAMKAFDEGKSLKEAILENPEASRLLSANDVDEITDPESYCGDAEEQVGFVKAYVLKRRKTDQPLAQIHGAISTNWQRRRSAAG